MKLTYTANDGTNFETEADCLGWERFTELKDEATNTLTDPKDEESWDQELDGFLREISGEEGSFYGGMPRIWKERKHLYRMVELMKQAEVK